MLIKSKKSKQNVNQNWSTVVCHQQLFKKKEVFSQNSKNVDALVLSIADTCYDAADERNRKFFPPELNVYL